MTVTNPAPAPPTASEQPARQGVMHDLTNPDDEIRWNTGDAESVEAARTAFARHMSTGAVAYRTDDVKNGGDQIRDFTPDAAVIVVARPLQGG